MKVTGIFIGTTVPMSRLGIENFGESDWARRGEAKILAALWAEKVWSGDFACSTFLGFSEDVPYLCISHPAFLSELRINISDDLTVDSVKEAVLAHIAAQLGELQKQSASLQIKSAALNDAQGHISRATAVEAVVAKHPEAAGCKLFAPYGGSDFTCFTLGEGFGHTIFVARGDCPEYRGGIVQIDMPGDEWIRLERREQYERFWAELAKVFAAGELKIPKDVLYWLKTFVVEVNCAYHANEVVLRRRFINEQVVVSFDVDSLPKKMVQVPDDENAEV